MSDQSDYISQIQQEEKKAEKALENAEKESNQRVLKADESAAQIITDVEEKAKSSGREKLQKVREQAKEEYKRVLVEFDSNRTGQIESGKNNLPKAKKLVHENLIKMLSAA